MQYSHLHLWDVIFLFKQFYMSSSQRLIFIFVHGIILYYLFLGGFAEFSRCFPGLCEGKSTLVPTCISQPCLPVANIGPTRILPNLYLGCQRDVLNKVGALKIPFIAGFVVRSWRNSAYPLAVMTDTPGSQRGSASLCLPW